MPYSRKAKYKHRRRIKPSECEPGTFRTVPISHTSTKKKYPSGTKAIVCRISKPKRKPKWRTQSVLKPKKKLL